MRCPFCSFEESKVIDSRSTDEGATIRRRRECMSCAKRFTSYEKVETIPVMVIKKDKAREIFSREKILNGILRACEKRPVSMETMENIVDEIETNIYNTLDKEVTSVKIGEMVIEKLKHVDQVAYVRFASVYRQFKDINSFVDKLNKIIKENVHKSGGTI
jgi:transcriptional repressor NrdR